MRIYSKWLLNFDTRMWEQTKRQMSCTITLLISPSHFNDTCNNTVCINSTRVKWRNQTKSFKQWKLETHNKSIFNICLALVFLNIILNFVSFHILVADLKQCSLNTILQTVAVRDYGWNSNNKYCFPMQRAMKILLHTKLKKSSKFHL